MPHTAPPAAGGATAADPPLIDALYAELRSLARRHARANHGHQTTSLAHEAWIRLRGYDTAALNARREFAALAATVIRSVVADHARRAAATKRGGTWRRSPADVLDRTPAQVPLQNIPPDLLHDLENALADLERLSPRRAAIVELRFYAGLAHEEIAAILGVSLRTVQQEWRLARAFLLARLEEPDPAR